LLKGFSLIEILVAMSVLALMSVMILSVISSVQRVTKQTASRTEQFREARRAFERINQRLSEATLNTYLNYVDASGQPRTTGTATFVPYKYARISELRYLQTGTNAASVPLTAPHANGTIIGQAVFFQAPIGQTGTNTLSSMNSLLNTVGYFLEKGSDSALRPPTVTSSPKIRYRLFELTEPTESLTIYSLTSGSSNYTGNAWFTTPLANTSYLHRLADNIVALLFEAEYLDTTGTATSSYPYNSAPLSAGTSPTQPITENNLPSTVHVTMIAVDEASARRIQDLSIPLIDAQNDDQTNPPPNNSLQALENQLQKNQLNYRKFDSVVFIGSAKWSAK